MDNLILSTGAHESPLDPRDWTLASVGVPQVYPSSNFIDIAWRVASMQGKIGCCVGCTGEEIVAQIVHFQLGMVGQELSFRFVYALAKCLDDVPEEGTFPSLVAWIIKNYGVPLAKYCPNDVSLSHEDFVYQRKLSNIPAEAFADAKTRCAGNYMTVPLTLEGIKQAVTYAKTNNGGVMILRSVGNTYYTAPDGTTTWDKDKILPIKVPTQITSGHEEFLYGYDEEPGTGRMRIYWLNHWSPEWADNGRGWEYADVWLPNIKEIRVVVAKLPPPPLTFTYHFTHSLMKGNQGADVVALQHALKIEGCFPETQEFTGYFGNITFLGVVQFQNKYKNDILTPVGLSVGNGFVGSNTLAKLNALYNK